MKARLVLVILTFPLLHFGQNAIVGTGFSGGWGAGTCPTNANDLKYFATGIANTQILTTPANGTGNQYFRFAVDWSGAFKHLTLTPGTDISISHGVKYSLDPNCTTAGAMYINVPSTAYNYVFKTLDAGTDPTGDFVFFEIQGDIRTVTSVSRDPASVPQGGSPTITAELSGAFATGQAVYLRYTTDAFASSTVVKMTGSGTTYSASIPSFNESTNVIYYVFTAGDVESITGGDADLYAINLNNNSGTNYTYTVGAPLPVSLTSFSAEKNSTTATLRWSTGSEQDNDHFVVQRTGNMRTWEAIGKVPGKGTTLLPQDYLFIDRQPLSGPNYYRLQQTDRDGSYEYSPVVQVTFSDLPQIARLYPNPVLSELSFTLPAGTENPVATIHDTQGRLLLRQTVSHPSLPVGSLPAGTYFLQLTDGRGLLVFRERFVKD
ncbi:MAG: hypothetical protein RLY31_2138 [Bacteroidota bacterium]